MYCRFVQRKSQYNYESYRQAETLEGDVSPVMKLSDVSKMGFTLLKIPTTSPQRHCLRDRTDTIDWHPCIIDQ